MFESHRYQDSLLVIQCDSGHLYGDLLACARYLVEDERERWFTNCVRTHVLFIIRIPQRKGTSDVSLNSFVGFQGGKWLSAHIDDLKRLMNEMLYTLIKDDSCDDETLNFS